MKFFQVLITKQLCVINLPIENENGTESKRGGEAIHIRKCSNRKPDARFIGSEGSSLDFKRKLSYFEKVIVSTDLRANKIVIIKPSLSLV